MSAPSKQTFAQNFAEQIIEALKNGTAPWQRPWKAGEYVSPMNPVSGTRYSGVNFVALSMQLQGRADPRFVTFKQASGQDWRIKKGEHGATVEYWQFAKMEPVLNEDGSQVVDAEGKPKTQLVQLDRPIVKHFTVFHASQIDGIPAWEIPQQPDWSPSDRAETILANSGAKIAHDLRDRAYYRPSSDEIHLPPKAQFGDELAYYSTVLHELAHWTGNESRMNREFGPFGSEIYAREELRAEIASWMLAAEIGVPFDPGQHTAYVASWIKAIENDPHEIFRACRDAEKIKDFILAFELTKELTGAERGEYEGYLDGHSSPMPEATVSKQRGIGQVRVLAQEYVDLLKNSYRVESQDEFDALNQKKGRLEKEAEQLGHASTLTFLGRMVDESSSLLAQIQIEQTSNPEYQGDLDALLKFKQDAIDTCLQTLEYKPLHEEMLALLNSAAPFLTGELEAIGRDVAKMLESPAPSSDLIEDTFSDAAQGIFSAHFSGSRELQDITRDLLGRSLASSEESYLVEKVAELREQAFMAKQKEPAREPQVSNEKTWLKVPYNQRYLAKAAGAKWDGDAKLWFAPAGTPLSGVSRWMPDPDNILATQKPMSPQEEFADALQRMGLDLQGEQPVMDGKIHRVPLLDGPRGKRDGAYKGYLDGLPAGFIENHASGNRCNWKYSGHRLSASQIASLRENSAKHREEAAKAIEAQHAKAAKVCYAIWKNSEWAPSDHPYLEKKQVPGFGVKIDGQGNLVIPGRDAGGFIHTIQTILPSAKRFEPGSRKSGTFHLIDPDRQFGKGRDPLLVAEGYATAASIHMAVGLPCVSAFDAGNILPVVKALREQYPDLPIVIMADNDHQHTRKTTDGGEELWNKGVELAKAAALEVGGEVLAPEFSADEKALGLNDFNDLHVSSGLEAVHDQIAPALEAIAMLHMGSPAQQKASGLEKGSEKIAQPDMGMSM